MENMALFWPENWLANRPPCFEGQRLFSRYLTMRDGVQIAIDVHLPGTIEAENDRFPVVVFFTPYYRRMKLKPGAPEGTEDCPNIAIFRSLLLARGYALVAVDVRGSGASFGTRNGLRSPNERGDYLEIVEWINQQPWCKGSIGVTGISYLGAAADFTASWAHPAVKAIVPHSAVWDTWSNQLYPGGVMCRRLVKEYGNLMEALDDDRAEVRSKFPYFKGDYYDGPAPVDEDEDGSILEKALKDHVANFDMADFVHQLTFRDRALHTDPDFTSEIISPYYYANQTADAQTAVYTISGWMDGHYSRGAALRYQWQQNPHKRLMLGAWDHGARTGSSPYHNDKTPQTKALAETLRFFDEYLMGLDTGMSDEAPVHYYTVGEERWKSANEWPPAETNYRTLFFQESHRLGIEPPATKEAFDHYVGDYSCGTGESSRYNRLYAQNVDNYYSDWHDRDKRMLCYTTDVFEKNIEVTGHPIIRLYLTSDTQDCALFVYLEDIDKSGKVHYVTEGVFRALHRRIAEGHTNIPNIGPSHSFLERDARYMTPGECSEITFDLLPTSWLFKAGHRLRIAIALADSDHFSRIPDGVIPTIEVYRNSIQASCIELPIIES
ncbi:CocE/NonD family hydrolase [Vreelandella titanicae]|jgi:putative CocE/NonD family hydrolase|uniref:CocE/NonD hydrolase n=1 Tax=Vreelandella titanicae BH1 TaxID=1204738 RepID=L9UD20_9GAMM|nr:CocE/NonD family hydrolase [Halomonas titanicae]ELY22870.1 CocE/NonD hydrolase [Halomonas titanicae BH1]MCE7517894.1 CocE/NonD family hydrolase [Halomonas titanicae]NVE89239.1 CocE/NonD family hydrolase [Halomonas titanicae]QNU63679.1 CocE/NonD family hydrolase [Halomonas titanicae]|tara:strand:+ start:1479 stop:3302 length:1824 start_codon:yes stop_codon:yes gene_type:complete